MIKIQWLAWIWWRNDQNNAKLGKWSNYNELHRYDVKKIENVELRRKTFKTTQYYESDQIIMNCIDLTSKRSIMLSYVAKHSQQHKATKLIKLQLIASIGWQNDHNNAKLRKLSNYDELHRFDDKTIKNVELRRKTFTTTQSYKTDQITINCIDWMSKRSIMLSYVAKHSKQR